MSLMTDLADAVAVATATSALYVAIVEGPADGPTSIVTTANGDVKTLARIARETLELASARSFEFKTELDAAPGTLDGEVASVWGDTTELSGVYTWDTGTDAWIRRGDNIHQLMEGVEADIAAIEVAAAALDARVTTAEADIVEEVATRSSVVAPQATGILASSVVITNQSGWIVMHFSQNVLEVLTDNFGVWPINDFVAINESGWIIENYDIDEEPAATVDTDEHVAAVLNDQVEAAPLLGGANLLFGWGESKANLVLMKSAFDEIYAAEIGAYPVGVSVSEAYDNHGGHTLRQLLDDQVAAMRTAIDTAFTAGAEALSFVAFVMQANDMIEHTDPAEWEASMLEAIDTISRYGLQKYVGTDPTDPVPVPPIFQIMDCTWAKDNYSIDIPLRSVDMARRHYRYGLAAPDYICEFSDNLHWIGSSRSLMIAYLALAAFWWRALGKKYAPTQVVEGWLDGSDFYLRCEMPHAPLVADTTLVSTIAQNGLQAVVSGANSAISALSIVGGGRIIKGTTAAPLASGDIVQGGITGTTLGTSGKLTGPRTMYHDSSTYTVTISASPVTLYSPLLPFIARADADGRLNVNRS